MSLIYNATFDKNTRKLSFEDKAGNEIYSFTVPERGPAVDNITKPLTFKATQDGSTVKLTKTGSPVCEFQTSRDGGKTWKYYPIDTVITLNTGDKVSFRTLYDRTTSQGEQSDMAYFHFIMEGKIEAWHNVMSLYRTNDFATYNTAMEYSFYHLFYGCTSLTKAPILPATTLANECYRDMFHGCTSLIKAPELPATPLADACYAGMFNGCTSLVNAPVLPATTLTQYCYSYMFEGCTSLTETPALPATSLAQYCYYRMFYGCTSLTEAPALPATALANYCYSYMLYGCTSLTEAPALPATTLDAYCYSNMFDGCTSLTKASALPATTLDVDCYDSMFKGCTSLTKAPELPAATLNLRCYESMFDGCSSLNEVHCKIPSSYSSSNISSYAKNWLSGVSPTGTFYTNEDANWPSGASGIPTGWNRVNESAPSVDDITKPLTFRSTQDGSTVRLRKEGTPSGSFQTSRDGGKTWTDYTLNTAITLNNGDEVSFRAKADRTTDQTTSAYFYFMMEGKIEAWHNAMSLYRTNDFATYESVVKFAFRRMFYDCTSLTKAPALPATTLSGSCYDSMFYICASLTKAPELPATTLGERCYQQMFYGCTSLVNAPVLPATTLDQSCYSSMFNGCTSLVNAPVLPATTLATECYAEMFYGCTSLTEAPALPATTLATYCYYDMFAGCTSLTKAPALPATTLADTCYWLMFGDCTSLTQAPELPATTLADNCYSEMFKGCTSLTKAPELPATTLAQYCYESMFNGCSSLNEVHCKIPSSYSSSDISSTYAENWLLDVSSTGTFYTNADANWPSGANGIPTGWTRVNEGAPAVDGIRKPLTFRSTQDGSTVRLRKEGTPSGSFQTSRDGGKTWTDYTIGTYITLNTGREVSFRAKADRTTDQTVKNYFYFEMTGKIEAWHNVMSLYRTNDFATYSRMVSHAFYKLFLNCTSLTKAPKLPVTTLAHSCYYSMFNGCTSLTKAPALPVTTLAVQCYYSMFSGCTSLTEAPALPATTLAGSCYPYMFYGCTSLTKTPALSATTLADHCYSNMFRNCSNLNEVRCKMSSSYSSNAISTYAPYWLSGVSSKGTFYTNADANWPSGDDGIPQTWTRANIDDYPTT